MSAAVLAVLCGCERETVYEYAGTVRIQPDYVLESTLGEPIDRAESLMAHVYSPRDNRRSANSYMSADGDEFDVEPGNCHILVHGYGTYNAKVLDPENLSTIRATTVEVPFRARQKVENEPIVYEPEHVYLGVIRDTLLTQRAAGEDVPVIKMKLRSVTHAYRLVVHFAEGNEYISSAAGYITGQKSATYLGDGNDDKVSPVTILTEGGYDKSLNSLVINFNTFGRCANAQHAVAFLTFTDTGGNARNFNFDISNAFDSPEHVITINSDIKIPKPTGGSGGGFNPDVKPWNGDEVDIDI